MTGWSTRAGTRGATLRDWIADGLGGASELARRRPDQRLAEIRLRPSIPEPTHIVGIGLNTRSHFEETAALKNRVPGDYPKYPRLFLRSPASLGPATRLWLLRLVRHA